MKNQFRRWMFLTILVVVSLVASTVSVSPVKADGTTLTVVYPTEASGCLGDEITVTVRVDNVANLYGYDLRLIFNPALLEVTSLTNGGWLSPDYQNIKTVDNATGFIRLSVTQSFPTPAKNGSGTLLIIKLRPKTPNQTIALTLLTASRLSDNSTPISQYIPYSIAYGNSIITQACDGYLTINPVEPYASFCYNTEIKIRAENVADVYGIQIDMAFDKSVINVVSIIDEHFLNDNYTVFQSIFDNAAGTLSFVAFELNPALPKSGSGDIITLVVRGMAPNASTNLTFSSATVISDRDGMPIWTYPVNGVITTNNCEDPTAVDMLPFTATSGTRSVTLNWETTNEVNNLGFNIYRASSEKGKRTQLNDRLIRSLLPPGSLVGAQYEYVDTSFPGKTGDGTILGTILRQAKNSGRPYYYWIESVSISGETKLMGPLEVRVRNK